MGPSGPHPLPVPDCNEGKKAPLVYSQPTHSDPRPRFLGGSGGSSSFLAPTQAGGARVQLRVLPPLGRGPRLYGQRVDRPGQLFGQRSVDQPVPLQGAQALKARAHHRHSEMRLTAWWDRVAAALVTQLQHLGVQGLLQLRANGGLNRTDGPRSRAAPGQTDAAGHGEQASDQLPTQHRLRLSLGYRSFRSGTRLLTFLAKCGSRVLRHAGKWSSLYVTVDWTGVT